MLSATPADVTAVQQNVSSNYLLNQISQLASVESSRSAVQSFAQGVLKSNLTTDQNIVTMAEKQDIIQPQTISEPVDKAVAAWVSNAVGTSQFDTRYLSTRANVEQLQIDQARQLTTTTTSSSIVQAVQPEIATDTSTRQQAQSLAARAGRRFDHWVGRPPAQARCPGPALGASADRVPRVPGQADRAARAAVNRVQLASAPADQPEARAPAAQAPRAPRAAADRAGSDPRGRIQTVPVPGAAGSLFPCYSCGAIPPLVLDRVLAIRSSTSARGRLRLVRKRPLPCGHRRDPHAGI